MLGELNVGGDEQDCCCVIEGCAGYSGLIPRQGGLMMGERMVTIISDLCLA